MNKMRSFLLVFLLLLPMAVQAEIIAATSPNDLLELPGMSLPEDKGAWIGDLGYTGDGKILLSASISSKDGLVSAKLWDTSNWSLMRVIAVDKDQKMAISRDGRWLATSNPDKISLNKQNAKMLRPIRIWDAGSGALVHTLNGHTDGVISLTFSRDGAQLISSSLDDTLRIWDVASEQQLFKIPAIYGRHLTLMPDGHQLMVESDWAKNLVLKLIDIASGKEVRTIALPTEGMVAGLAVSPDGQRVAITGINPNQVEILQIASGNKLPPLGLSKVGIENAVFSSDGRQILIDSWGGLPSQRQTQYRLMEIWDGAGTALQRTIKRTAEYEGGGVFCISPDNRQLAYGTENGVIEIWDVWQGAELASLAAARKYANTLESLPRFRRGEESESQPHYLQAVKFEKDVPPNYGEALKLYQLAAENGHARAAYLLGYMYRDGKGTSIDLQQSIKWSRVAIELGYAEARSSLVYSYAALKNYDQALMWAYLAAADSPQKKYAEEQIASLQARLTGAKIAEVQRLAKACTVRRFKGC